MTGLEGSTRTRVAEAAARLRDAGVPTPGADAEWLLAGLLGMGRASLRVALDEPLPAAVATRYEAAVARRAAREPLQRILGWEGFQGLRLDLSPDVLVPRPETEVLAQWAVELLPPPGASGPTVVDAGTGSGCIACAVGAARPDARVLAVDSKLPALAVARDNVGRLGLGARVRAVGGDLVSALRAGSVDLVVANLPYLPTALLGSLPPEVRDHEPRCALDGGPDGLREIRRLVADARRVLRRGGAIALETMGDEQAGAVAALLERAGYGDVRLRVDLAGVARFVAARAGGERAPHSMEGRRTDRGAEVV
jgi:release factor glutamine methyltransferase